MISIALFDMEILGELNLRVHLRRRWLMMRMKETLGDLRVGLVPLIWLRTRCVPADVFAFAADVCN